MTQAIVIMGVSGSGKSTVGTAVATALGTTLIEGDDFHPPANIAKMEAGTPLTDADRTPWLDAVADAMKRRAEDQAIPVAACSALKRTYRDRLRLHSGLDILFLHLTGSRAALVARMEHRTGHFMPVALLDDQLATLEPPQPDEWSLTVDMDMEPQRIIAEVAARLSAA